MSCWPALAEVCLPWSCCGAPPCTRAAWCSDQLCPHREVGFPSWPQHSLGGGAQELPHTGAGWGLSARWGRSVGHQPAHQCAILRASYPKPAFLQYGPHKHAHPQPICSEQMAFFVSNPTRWGQSCPHCPLPHLFPFFEWKKN